jgi:hypothetical protein
MIDEIPDRLKDDRYLIKIKPETKEPVGKADTGPFYHASDPELRDWFNTGGNIGKALNGPLIVVDIDQTELEELLDRSLPDTFTVQSGGGGEHRYYHCPNWDRNLKFNSYEGSIRTDSWQVVIPPSVHPSGTKYSVLHDSPIRSIGAEEVETVLDRTDTDSANTGGGRGAAAPRVGGIPTIPSEYPNKSATWTTLKKWLSANGFLEKLNRSSGDRSSREFLLAKCLAEGGFSESAISEALDRLPHDSKWHERGDNYQIRTVRKAVKAACDDPYVDFESTADMDANTSERRKTETIQGSGNSLNRGESKMSETEYTTTNEVTVTESSDQKEGEYCIRATVTKANSEEESYEFAQILGGQIEQDSTFGPSPNWQSNEKGQDKTRTIGSSDPDYLRTVAKALNELADELE